MSAEKGGALVRSPPGLVEAYNAHVTGSAKWREPSSPPIPPHKQTPPQRNASVTKHPSGSYQGSTSTYNGSTTSSDTKLKKFGIYEEEDSEGECGCNSWARARQLEHDLDQLQRTHDVILSGLHNQLEEMKQKNRDLTFQLLMGPYANAVQVGVPLSPESDTTSPKDPTKDCGNSILGVNSFSDQIIEASESNHVPTKDQTKVIQDKSDQVKNKKKPKGKSTDPRHARSLDLEIMEEEAEELTKELEEERAKNKYLTALVEDLKRQIREETGSWYPPPPTVKRQSFKPNFDGRRPSYPIDQATNPNLFKLPQLAYDQRPQMLDQEQPIQQLVDTNGKQGGQQRKDGPKSFERSKDSGASTTLPAIVQTGKRHERKLQPSKLGDKGNSPDSRESPSYTPKGKSHKNKMKSRHHSSEQSEAISQRSVSEKEERPPQKEQQQQKTSQTLKLKTESRADRESRKPSRKGLETTKSNSVQHRFQEQVSNQNERRSSPRPRHSEVNEPRTRTLSRGRAAEGARTSREGSAKGKVADLPLRSRASNSPSVKNGPFASYNDSDGATKEKTKSLENAPEFSLHSSSSSLNTLEKAPETNVASSSSSLGSLGSNNSKTKHRGRTNKRGGKKNRKEIQETLEEPKDK